MNKVNFSTDYARSYGRHDFTLANGDVASVISQPTWEAYIESLATSQDLGRIALSPELITSPMPLDQIPGQATEIQARTRRVVELSRQVADTTIVLGTATFNTGGQRPANSLLFIRDGEVVAQKNKSVSLYPLEKEVFTLKPAAADQTPDSRIAALVCSDLLGEKGQFMDILTIGSDNPNPQPSVTAATETVVFSSCWAIPIITSPGVDKIINREDRFRSQLENRIGELFSIYPNLREVLVADRLAPISGVDGPYNCHFQREDLEVS